MSIGSGDASGSMVVFSAVIALACGTVYLKVLGKHAARGFNGSEVVVTV